MFDHLDAILETDITQEFSRIWGLASNMTPFEGEVDPYTLASMLGINKGAGALPNDDALLAKMASFNPKWNTEIWKMSLDIPKVSRLLKEWNWYQDTSKASPAKWFVDKYDYNGDGRLSPREFVIAMIKNNKKILEMTGTRACKNCLSEIIGRKIDPLYMYIDCANTNMITAEQIWKNFKTLKRTDPQNYNMYNCSLSSGAYRTTAVNDFVIKAQKSVEGKLTKEEFRLGILIGYWDRHLSDTIVFLNDGKTAKDSHRWQSADKTKDTVCEKIKSAIAGKSS